MKTIGIILYCLSCTIAGSFLDGEEGSGSFGSGEGSGLPFDVTISVDPLPFEGSGELHVKTSRNVTEKSRMTPQIRKLPDRSPESDDVNLVPTKVTSETTTEGGRTSVKGSSVTTTLPEKVVSTTKAEEAIIFEEEADIFETDSEREEDDPSTVEQSDDIQLTTEKIPIGKACTSSCPYGSFVLTTVPARLVTEETNDKLTLKCQAQYTDEELGKVRVEFEWLFRTPAGKPCSLGPATNHDRCSNLFDFSTDKSVEDNIFVSSLHVSKLTANHSGTVNCTFTAFCCSTTNNGQIVEVMKIESSSELVVFVRPDYTLSLSISATITTILCLILSLALFLYFRFEHDVKPKTSSLEKTVVKSKHMVLAIPPVLMDPAPVNLANEQDRDSYSSFDSAVEAGDSGTEA